MPFPSVFLGAILFCAFGYFTFRVLFLYSCIFMRPFISYMGLLDSDLVLAVSDFSFGFFSFFFSLIFTTAGTCFGKGTSFVLGFWRILGYGNIRGTCRMM